MTTEGRVTFPNIVRIPGVCGGDPVVRDTRVPVWVIAAKQQTYGSLDAIQRAYPHIPRERLQEALDYYAAHQDAIDEAIRENE